MYMDEFDEDEEYYERVNYRELLKMRPDNFYLHLPVQLPFLKWFFELRLQLLLLLGVNTNYFGMRHRLDPLTQWFSDWIFINHYYFDFLGAKKWKPTLIDKHRYQWLKWQGYAKEWNQYNELRIRKMNKQVTVQERKFLDKYEQCRYWSYLDSTRDEELGFFRLGLDRDEHLQDEDRPLFPNIAYSYPDDPRLAYFVGNRIATEHIPKPTSWLTKQKARLKIMRKWKRDEKVDYADIRPMFNSDTTKIHDLEFLFHVFDKHAADPENESEKKLYDKLHLEYSIEIRHLAEMMHFPELEKLNISANRKRLNPLYIAYKQRWFGINPVKEFQDVFHGVTYDEYQEIVNKQYKLLEKTPQKKSKRQKHNEQKNKNIDDLIIKSLNQK
jgi:hypothetical protein